MASSDLPIDAASQSNWQDVTSEHVDFEWSLDFNTQLISGSATHHLVVKKDGAREVMYVPRIRYPIDCNRHIH